ERQENAGPVARDDADVDPVHSPGAHPVSFFDDDDFDEPTHVADAPRRGGSRLGGLGGDGGGRGPGGIDPQTARQRQLVALGVIVVVLILLVLAVRGCVNSGRTAALKDYSRDVTAVLQESS